jgi:hypothetical protein
MSEMPARLRYTELEPEPLAVFERREEAAEPPSLLDRVSQPLTWGTVVVCLVVWAMAGAVFWVPAMIRRVAIYSVALVDAMMDGERPEEAGRRLRTAITFYARGFVTTVEVLTGTAKDDKKAVARDPEASERPLDVHRLTVEAIWAAAVWYLVLVVVGVVETSPLDVWRWFWAQPWSEISSIAWTSWSNWITGLF